MQFNHKKLVIALGVIIVLIVAFLVVGRLSVTAPAAPQGASALGGGAAAPASATDCTVREVTSTVTGDSLGTLVKNGDTVKVLQNYYACNPVVRDDIIVYHYSGSVDPLIKEVKGVSGDALALQQVKDGWNIMINGKALTNSEGKLYTIGDAGYRVLSLYVHDYHGVIPPDAYLILGDNPAGTIDSTRFGLVDKSDFIGKVVL
jgi:signal peptidase I